MAERRGRRFWARVVGEVERSGAAHGVSAEWSGGADLDVALIDAQGKRTSWLGSAGKATTARDVTSQRNETLAELGAPARELRGGDLARRRRQRERLRWLEAHSPRVQLL